VTDVMLEPCDVLMTKGRGFISRAIRFFSRGIGENRTQVNHVGLVVETGTLETAVVIEALSRIKKHKLWSEYGPPAKDEVAVYRPTNLTDAEKEAIVAKAHEYKDMEYGYLMIAAHLADWLLFGAYFFRRLIRADKYPICSWLVAASFGAANKHFGVDPGQAQPDDIWDFVRSHPKVYTEVHPLKRLGS